MAMDAFEDSPQWKTVNEETVPGLFICVSCKKTITLYHCAESGCPWCAICGTNSKEEK